MWYMGRKLSRVGLDSTQQVLMYYLATPGDRCKFSGAKLPLPLSSYSYLTCLIFKGNLTL